MKINQNKALILLAIVPLLLFIQIGIGTVIFMQIKNGNDTEAISNRLELYLRANIKYVANAESAQRGYLLTGDTKFRDVYNTDLAEWKKNEAYYETLPAVCKRKEVKPIKSFAVSKLAEMNKTISLYDSGNKDAAVALVRTGEGTLLMDSLRTRSTAFRQQIAGNTAAQRAGQYNLLYAFFILIVFMLVFSAILTWLIYKAFGKYADSMEELVLSLEATNKRIVEYNYYSYHNLKSPLRNITGFMQLLRKKYHMQLDEEALEYIHLITVGVRKLNSLIVDMRQKYLEVNTDEGQKKAA